MFQSKTYQNDQINKQTDQMYVLLAICLVLHPKRIDESLHATLKENSYAEKKSTKCRTETLTNFRNRFCSRVPSSCRQCHHPWKTQVTDGWQQTLGTYSSGFSWTRCDSRLCFLWCVPT